MKDIVIAIVASPVVAGVVAILAVIIILMMTKVFKLHEDHVVYQVGQIASSCWVSWGHGSNDAQKTMGVVAATLFAGGYLGDMDPTHLEPPTWVIFGAHAAIAAGTLYGGWSIIETMGLKITKITRATGLAANIGALVSINGATNFGIPISTTQAVSSSIVGSGVGARRRVNWLVMRDMVIAWIFTMPVAAAIGFVVFQLTVLPGVLAYIATGVAIVALVIYAVVLMRGAMTAQDVAEELPSEAELVGTA